MWRLVRTLEEVEESLVYWPFTLRGSVLAVGIPIAIALLIVIIFESCQATGSCSRYIYLNRIILSKSNCLKSNCRI